MQETTAAEAFDVLVKNKHRKRQPVMIDELASGAEAIAGTLSRLASALRDEMADLLAAHVGRAAQRLSVLGNALDRLVSTVTKDHELTRRTQEDAAMFSRSEATPRKRSARVERMLAHSPIGRQIL